MINKHFFKVLVTFIIMILVGIAFLFFSGGAESDASLGTSQK
jgi:hypothetical protein